MSRADASDGAGVHYGSDHQLRKRVRDYILQCHSPCKEWFKANEIAKSLDERTQEVGRCLADIERQPSGLVRVVESRGSSSTPHRYRIEIRDGGGE